MAWKGLHITRPGRLSFGDGQIIVMQEDGDVRLPLEDIGWIIIDEHRISLTVALISACAEHGIAIVVTDERHMPSSLTLPFHRHHRQASIAARQTGLSLPFKKRCWQAIIRAKLTNQAYVLEINARQHAPALRAMAKLVSSGDAENTEARGARQYWSALFEDFIRDDPSDLRNKSLNYGYAIMRAGVARALVGVGFLPSIGLHHVSQTNAFNLADDVIEPFRPFVDKLVFERVKSRSATDDLTIDDRRFFAGLLLEPAHFGSENMSLLAACEASSMSLARAMEADDPALLKLRSLVGQLELL